MSAVRKAEQRIHDAARTKTYMGVVGNKGFSSAVVNLVFDGQIDESRIRTVNGPGGTGALSILMNVLSRARKAQHRTRDAGAVHRLQPLLRRVSCVCVSSRCAWR